MRKGWDECGVRGGGGADMVVVKVGPLGGVRQALRVAAECGLPVVVSSAVESSVGLAAGAALAAALPELDYDCGLGTMQLLTGDVTARPLLPERGMLPLRVTDIEAEPIAGWESDPAPWRRRGRAAPGVLGWAAPPPPSGGAGGAAPPARPVMPPLEAVTPPGLDHQRAAAPP